MNGIQRFLTGEADVVFGFLLGQIGFPMSHTPNFKQLSEMTTCQRPPLEDRPKVSSKLRPQNHNAKGTALYNSAGVSQLSWLVSSLECETTLEEAARLLLKLERQINDWKIERIN